MTNDQPTEGARTHDGAGAARPAEDTQPAGGSRLDETVARPERARDRGDGGRLTETRGASGAGSAPTLQAHDDETTLPPDERGAAAAGLEFLAASDRPDSLGRLGSYEVLGRVGEGAMGVVLKALDPRLNRIVAVKVLMPALAGNTQARRRFLREAQAAAAVCHEHVVTIHAVDEVGGLPFLVMQLVAGQSLQQKLNRDGPPELMEILRIGMQIGSGLAAAHAQGLVHRDIKPANILLENGVARVKVTDFGLARALDDASVTTTGTIAGTPRYMSPEQARGEPVDYRSDLFSFGSVLYALCTGQPPFRGDSAPAVLRKVCDEHPEPIRARSPELPEWLEAIVARLMAKDPDRRYQSAAEVAELLARHLAELRQPVRPAQPVPDASPQPKAARLGGPLPILISGAALAIVCVTWWTVHTRDARQAAARRGSVDLEEPPRTKHAAVVERAPDASVNRPPEPPAPPAVPAQAETKGAIAVATPADAEIKRRARDEIELGELSLKRGDRSRAIEHFSTAIHLDPTDIVPLLKRAEVYRVEEVGNWAGAIADAAAAMRLDARNIRALDTLAYASNRIGDNRTAVNAATEILRLDSRYMEAYALRGSAYLGLKEPDHAIVDFDKVLGDNPKRIWPTYGRGTAYEAKGDLVRAQADFGRAIQLDGKIPLFWLARGGVRIRQGDDKGGLADLDQAMNVSGAKDRYSTVYSRAGIESAGSLIDQAIADYSELIQLDRKRVEAKDSYVFVSRGGLYLARGETEPALGDLEQAIRLNRRDAMLFYLLGVAYTRKGQWENAVAAFRQGAAASGEDKQFAGACLSGIGEARGVAGQFERAEAAFRETIQFDPNRLAPVLMSRAWYVDRRRGDYDAAFQKLDEACKTGMILPYLYRGLMRARIGMADAALADFAEVTRRVKARPDWFGVADFFSRRLAILLGRGEAYLTSGDLEQALRESDEAVRFDPRSADARRLRAKVYSKLAKPDLAAADAREAGKLVADPVLAFPEGGGAGKGAARGVQ
jgi:tetratricopeptide (TPR) repeat protein